MVTEQKPDNTLTRHRPGFSVTPSPFNTVKPDLGVIVLLGFLLSLMRERITQDLRLQFLLLIGHGIMGAAWIVVRARRIVASLTSGRRRVHNGPQ